MGAEEATMGRPNKRDRTTHRRISDAIAEAAGGYALPGTFLERNASCNKAGCRCMADPPRLHGPYYQWTRKIDGKTKTTLLTAELVERYRPWFDNVKTIRALTAELEALSLDIASTTEDWN
jgi:hypothetical protein